MVLLGAAVTLRLHQKLSDVADSGEVSAMSRLNAPAVATTAPVLIRDISHTFEATGSVDAPLNVKIAPKITGRINFLQVHEGDPVRKGQVLVRIDATQDLEANVHQQAAALAEAQYRLAQAQMTQNPTNVQVDTQIRQQHAGSRSAKANLKQSKTSSEAQKVAAEAAVRDADAKIDNANAAISAANANLKDAQNKYTRTNNLYKQGFVAAQDVDDAEAALEVQKAALEIAQAQLRSASEEKESAIQQLNITIAKGEADVEAADAQYVQSIASLDYANANYSQKLAYVQSIAALKATVAAAKAALINAKAQLQDTVLISPLDGFVTGRYADPGAIVSPTQPIISVQYIRQVWVTAGVPEEECVKLRLGQTATVRFDAFPGSTYSASIIQINPSADVQSRQFVVRVIINNTDSLLKPGLFAHVRFETDRLKSALVVPREAIQTGKTGSYVMVVDKDLKARNVPVVPGIDDATFVSVSGDLTPGEQVVTMSANPVRNNQKIVAGGRRRAHDKQTQRSVQ